MLDDAQITEELRDLADWRDRHSTQLEELRQRVALTLDRDIPAAIADVNHTLNGVSQTLHNLSATVYLLASEVRAHADRLKLIEKNWE